MPSGFPIDTEGRSIGPLRLRHGMMINIISGTLICMTLAVMSPYAMICTVFMREQLQASRTMVGLNLALWVGAIVMALPGAYLFNRLRARRPTWVRLMVVGRAFLFVVALAALLSAKPEHHPALVILVILANVACVSLTSMTSAGWWSWMADLIPESVRGRFFGRRYQINLIATAATIIAASLLLERVTADRHLLYFIVFLVGAILGVVDPILFLWVPEPMRPPRTKRSLSQVVATYLRPLRDRNFAWLVWTQGLYTFLATMPVPFFVLFQRGETVGGVHIGCDISLQFLALMSVIALSTTALVAAQWGRLADRIGNRTVVILGRLWVFTTVAYFFMGPDNYVWLLPLQLFLQCLVVSGEPVAVQNLMIAIAPESEREYYVSIFWAVVAATGAIGPWLGGILADAVPVVDWSLPNGQPLCYLHLMLLVCYVGALVNIPLMMQLPDVRGERVLPWFARLISGGLFRTAINISQIAGTGAPSQRVKALQRIRHGDGNAVLPEIASALEDADHNVCREAILALGRLGTPEAIEMLLWEMHEPDPHRRSLSAQALGQSRSYEGAQSLVAALRDVDEHVRRSSIDALARLGDRRAADTLLDLIEDEQDSDVLMSAASALSRLHEFRSVRKLLVVALQNPSRGVRLHVVMALGDLLGPDGKFYSLYRREQISRGAAAEELGHKLYRQARAWTKFRRKLMTRDQRNELLARVEDQVAAYIAGMEASDPVAALNAMVEISLLLLEAQYGFQGDSESAMMFTSLIDPVLAEQHWLVRYLATTAESDAAPEAPWQALTLLAGWALFFGQAVR